MLVLASNITLLDLMLLEDKGINNRAVKQLEHVYYLVLYANLLDRVFRT